MSRLFPELDGVVPAAAAVPAPKPPAPAPVASAPAPSAAPAAATPATSGGGRSGSNGSGRPCVVGGIASMQRFDTLFGLPGPFLADGGCHVVAVRAFQDGDIELEVVGGGIPRTTISITPPAMGERFLSTEHFVLGYMAREAGGALLGMLRRAGQRLAKVTLPQLIKVVLMDPAKRVDRGRSGARSGASGHGSTPGEQHEDPIDMLHSLVQTYGSGEAWSNFFADKEQQRNFCHNVSGSIVMIGHEDLECHYATPPTNDGSFSFFNYPQIHDRYAPTGEGVPSVAHQAGRDPNYLISDLHDLDIIKGGAKKLDRALDSILEHQHKPEMVVVRATCVPIVIGDDMEGSVERFKKKTQLPVVYLDNIADQHATPFRDVFRNVKDAPDFKNPEKSKGSINLLGYPSETEMAPLLALLDALGISVNCRILPEIDVRVMRRYTRAELAVLFDCSLYDSDYKEIVGDVELPTIRPAPPYGVENTRRWLAGIASALGRSPEAFDAVWQAQMSSFDAGWAALRREVAGYRLGFVVDEARIPLLAEPRRWMGIPMVEVLLEMGFGLDFLVRVPPKGTVDPAAMIGGLGGAGTRVYGFSTPAELERRLRESDALAFYSDVYFDRRLTRSGKGQFSVQHFRVGLEGALYTVKQLLTVCRMPFYRKYANYLGQPFHV